MRLADFIEQKMPTILERWEAFAATQLPAAASMETLALRDHAEQILRAVVKDLNTAQTRQEQLAKSLGHAPVLAGAPDTAAQTHAILRAHSGFNINQLAAEYRALRASVLWLWMDACEPDPPDLEDLIRFNEAIDQALAESVGFFSTQVDRSRNLLLGMLGHDMRSPLQTITATATYLSAIQAGEAFPTLPRGSSGADRASTRCSTIFSISVARSSAWASGSHAATSMQRACLPRSSRNCAQRIPVE